MPEHRFSLDISSDELNLDRTLRSGQAFRWRQIAPGAWTGPLDGAIVRLVQRPGVLHVQSSDASLTPERIERWLRLDVSLPCVIDSLIPADPSLQSVFDDFRGLRLLAQPPVECLLSFVCAVATNIPRITRSINALCTAMGRPLSDGMHSFPDLDELARRHPDDLRVGDMEFRCRSLSRAARALVDRGGEEFLLSLNGRSYEDAMEELTRIPSVGRKVADCALLFSLGFDEAFPLDTHTWRAVEGRYRLPEHKRTTKGYRLVSTALRERFGQFAGWAQQYLYCHSLAG